MTKGWSGGKFSFVRVLSLFIVAMKTCELEPSKHLHVC